MAKEKISLYKKVKIFGSDRDYILVEYDFQDGAGVLFPWKYQLLLSTEGRLVASLSALRFEFIEIFKNENPYLLTVTSTSKGNGGHELFKISTDTLENVYECKFDYSFKTYDSHHDDKINDPYELILKVWDYNDDGFNDISFNGHMVFIEAPASEAAYINLEKLTEKDQVNLGDYDVYGKIAVSFIFLYDRKTGHFKAKENYVEKYNLHN